MKGREKLGRYWPTEWTENTAAATRCGLFDCESGAFPTRPRKPRSGGYMLPDATAARRYSMNLTGYHCGTYYWPLCRLVEPYGQNATFMPCQRAEIHLSPRFF